MDAALTLLPFVTLALVGAPHCAGMCGGFAITVAARTPSGRRALLVHQLIYAVGKALSYAVLGLLAATAFGAAAASLAGTRGALALLVGAALIGAGLGHLGLRLPVRLDRLGGLARAARRVWSGVVRLPGTSGALAIGLANGLVPCGLSYAAIGLAATREPWAAFLGPFVFGAATMPALLASAVGWRFASLRSRRVAAALAGPLLIVLGAWTCYRGAAAWNDVPGCCADALSTAEP